MRSAFRQTGRHGDREARRAVRIGLNSLAAACAFLLLSACSKGTPPPPRAVPVVAGTVERKDVPLQVKAIGNVEAYTTVAVRSQVSGEIAEVHFREGQDVSRGDLLFTIDPRPFESELRQAESALARDRAQSKNAQQEAERYAGLVEKGFVSRQEFDRARTNADALDAVVKAEEAAVENARLQLGYTSIRSPIAGRTGSIQVQQGNVVKANDIVLVTINQVVPIYVSFAVPEQELTAVKRYRSAGALRVQAMVPQSGLAPIGGELTFIDNTVNTQTGTIQLKATFPNRGRVLWPGQFVDVVIVLTTERSRTVVPQSAVQVGQQGQYVYHIKDDGTAELRPVTVARTYEQWAVIEQGLQAGEKVVTDGQLRLVPGAKVEIKNEKNEQGSATETPQKQDAEAKAKELKSKP